MMLKQYTSNLSINKLTIQLSDYFAPIKVISQTFHFGDIYYQINKSVRFGEMACFKTTNQHINSPQLKVKMNTFGLFCNTNTKNKLGMR